MYIRRFNDADAEEVSNLVCRNFREVNIRDYPADEMERLAESYSAEKISTLASSAHTYVACDGDIIVGTDSITGYWGSETESVLLTIFVLPEYQRKGIGSSIVRALEADEYFLRASRIEIPASITACEFYIKMGYCFKGGKKELDDEGHYKMEKFKFKLIKPDISYEKDILSFRTEMLDASSSMDGTGPLKRMESVTEWLSFNHKLENKDTVPADLVAAEQFIYVRETDNRIVGMIQFRHYLNDFMEKYGGHIGYSVRPNERRKGYAKRMLSDCLQICKAYVLENVLISCIQGNEGSKRTITANGGIYESTVYCEPDAVSLERYWVHL